MGYFSNGEEGDRYERQWCVRCVHGEDETFGPAACPVMHAHAMYNYDQCRDDVRGVSVKALLAAFIPRDDDGNNKRCLMFLEVAP